MAALTPDNTTFISVHGRRLGLIGDGVNAKGLYVDGVLLGGARSAVKTVVTGYNGAGTVTLAGVKVGDKVVAVINMTTPGDVTSSFESTISVDGQIQQTAATDLSAAKLLVEVSPRS